MKTELKQMMFDALRMAHMRISSDANLRIQQEAEIKADQIILTQIEKAMDASGIKIDEN